MRLGGCCYIVDVILDLLAFFLESLVEIFPHRYYLFGEQCFVLRSFISSMLELFDGESVISVDFNLDVIIVFLYCL